MKRKWQLIIGLVLALVVTGGLYAFTYTTTTATIDVAVAGEAIATTAPSATQPDWDSIITPPISLLGEVPSGDLFDITPNSQYSGNLALKVLLTNTGDLVKAYDYLNMKVYLEGSEEAGETPNYQLLTLQNGEVTFNMQELIPTSGSWTQTSQSDFQGGTLNQVDAITSPGDVILDTFTDNVTDLFDDETKIASKTNLVVSGGQVELSGAVGTETLRPDAAGDDTAISYQYPASGSHWDKVDDAAADDYSTYIYNNSTTYQRDLYNIPNHSTGSGAIDDVTAYFRFARNTARWGIVYSGPDIDGWLATTEISSAGQIGGSTVDTLEWDAADGNEPDIVHVSGNIYAIAYRGTGADGWLATVAVDIYGNITNTAINTLEWDAANGYTPDIIHVSGNIYAIAYRGTDADGWLCTVSIDSSGNISNATIDTLEWDAADGYEPDIVYVSGDVYAIAYRGTGADGWLCTVSIDSSGNISNTTIDTLEWDAANAYEPDIVHVSGDVYAIAYRGVDNDGWLATVSIDSSGNITNAGMDTYEWDTADGYEPNMAHVDDNYYAIAYRTGATNLGNLITVEIATNGQITDSIIDTLQFEATRGFTPMLIPVSGTSGTVYARATIKSGSTVATGSEESTGSDTFVTESYQWTTNPDTGQPWTWSEIDALQIGVELRTGSADISAACTQVYIVVTHAYYPTGTLTSINLLSAETVGGIDSFDYNSSAIPSGTGLKVQFSQNGSTWYDSSGNPGQWDTMSQGSHSIDLSGLGWSGSNFYYKMEFTSDGSDTPVLTEITVNFSIYYASGDLTSSAYDTGYDVEWGTISFTIVEPSTSNIQFQIRTAATEGGLSSATWYGPTGTGDYYTTSGTDINSVHDGDRWIQYKAYFSGPGDDTPTLRDVTITYSATAVSFTIEITGGSYCLVSTDPDEWEEGWTVTPEFYCLIMQR